MLKLFIGTQEAELDDNSNIALTQIYEDLTNPTVIQNTFSKTVSLPVTPRNNKIFDGLYDESHEILDYDPSKRTDFFLVMDGDLIDSGFMYVTKVVYSGQYPRYYEIQLSGNLGNFLLDINEEGKTLENLNFASSLFEHQINASSVVNSFTNEYYRYILSYSGLYDNFDSDKVFNTFESANITTAHMAYGNGIAIIPFPKGFVKITGKNIEVFENVDGFVANPRGIVYDYIVGQFIVWDGTEICYGSGNDSDGWSVENPGIDGVTSGTILDFNVVNSANDYGRYAFITSNGRYYTSNSFADGYVPTQLTTDTAVDASISRWVTEDQTVYANDIYGIVTYNRTILQTRQLSESNIIPTPSYTNPNTNILQQSVVPRKRTYAYSNMFFAVPNDNQILVAQTVTGDNNIEWLPPILTSTTGSFINVEYITEAQRYFFYGQNGTLYTAYPNRTFPVTWNIDNFSNNNIQNTNILKIGYSDGYYIAILYNNDTGLGNVGFSRDLINWEVNEGFYATREDETNENQRDEYRSYYQRPALRLRHIFEQILKDSGWSYTLYPEFFNNDNPYWNDTWLIQSRLKYIDEPPINHVGNIRSNDTITYQMMIKNGVSQQKFLISYTIAFGLYIKVDKAQKHVNIMSRNEFFANYGIIDWTNKTDFSGNMEIRPIPFDYKYGVFKWSNAGTSYETEYLTKYNEEYGQLRYDTGYNIDSESKDYFQNNVFYNLIMATRHDTLFEGRNSSDEYADNKILPALFTLSGNDLNYNDSSMHICFIEGQTTLSQPVRISDDNPDMLQLGIFMWNDSNGNSISTSQIPNVSRMIVPPNFIPNSIDSTLLSSDRWSTQGSIDFNVIKDGENASLLNSQYSGFYTDNVLTVGQKYTHIVDIWVDIDPDTFPFENYRITLGHTDGSFVYIPRSRFRKWTTIRNTLTASRTFIEVLNYGTSGISVQPVYVKNYIIFEGTVDRRCSLDFAEPHQIYYRGDYARGIGIFDKRFDYYISERLNVNNKLVTRYIYLTYEEYMAFSFNKFVYIKGNLWHVNKINDFFINRERNVKVELIRVKDINSYLNSQS